MQNIQKNRKNGARKTSPQQEKVAPSCLGRLDRPAPVGRVVCPHWLCALFVCSVCGSKWVCSSNQKSAAAAGVWKWKASKRIKVHRNAGSVVVVCTGRPSVEGTTNMNHLPGSSPRSPAPSPDPDVDDGSSKKQATRWVIYDCWVFVGLAIWC